MNPLPFSECLDRQAPDESRKIQDHGASPAAVLHLFRPEAPGSVPGSNRPFVLLLHGGAWSGGDAKIFFPFARYLAMRGVVAGSLDYRLADASNVGIGDCLADCRAALRWVRAQATELGVDPRRVAALGDSAGGHLAAALGTVGGERKPDAPPDALLLCNPILDLTGDPWIRHVIRGDALAKKPRPEDLLPTPRQRNEAEALSPFFHLREGLPLTLLMHGLDDKVVAPEQAKAYAREATKLGNRVDLVLLEGARHAFIVPKYTASEEKVVDAIRLCDEFLAGLGWISGPSPLVASVPNAWSVPAKK